MERTPVPIVPFAFGHDFQKKLIKLILQDEGVDSVSEHLREEYFENPVLRWTFNIVLDYRKNYAATPSFMVLLESARKLPVGLRGSYTQGVEMLRDLAVKEEDFIKDQVLDWVKRNLFVEAHQDSKHLFNAGKIAEAYDSMQKAMLQIEQTVWKPPDRGYFFEEFSQREARRSEAGKWGDKISSGIPDLDKTMGGGLSPGEMGVWIAYSKKGKSIMLLNHGVACTRAAYKNCLHIVLEGSRKLIEDRYDACFLNTNYNQLKAGNLDAVSYKHAFEEYKFLSGKLVVRAFLDDWDASIIDIDAELHELKRTRGWIPDMIIIDYGDLLTGRNGPYAAPWMSDRDAFRDIKVLANRGFAVWTAAQAQRAKIKEADLKPHLVRANDIGGGIDKIRVADFIGSINHTEEEKEKGLMRLFPELIRDSPGGSVITVGANFEHMKFGIPLYQPQPVVAIGQPKLGYKASA